MGYLASTPPESAVFQHAGDLMWYPMPIALGIASIKGVFTPKAP